MRALSGLSRGGRSGKEAGETEAEYFFQAGEAVLGRLWTREQDGTRTMMELDRQKGLWDVSPPLGSIRVESFKFPFNRRLRWSGFRWVRELWQHWEQWRSRVAGWRWVRRPLTTVSRKG